MGNYNTAARENLLKQGKALPGVDGGAPRFPIADAADLDSAIHLARTDEERRHTYKCAKAMNMLGKIPANWSPDGSLRDDTGN